MIEGHVRKGLGLGQRCAGLAQPTVVHGVSDPTTTTYYIRRRWDGGIDDLFFEGCGMLPKAGQIGWGRMKIETESRLRLG